MVQASSTRMSRLQQATQGLEERLQDREQQLLTYQVKLQRCALYRSPLFWSSCSARWAL